MTTRKEYPNAPNGCFKTFADCERYAISKAVPGAIYEQLEGYYAGYHLIVSSFDHFDSLPIFVKHANVIVEVKIEVIS